MNKHENKRDDRESGTSTGVDEVGLCLTTYSKDLKMVGNPKQRMSQDETQATRANIDKPQAAREECSPQIRHQART